VVLKIPILLCFALATSVVIAHDSPSHTIDEINKHHNLTPDQLLQRAIAQRATGHTDLAIADLKVAIHQSPKQLGYHLELARTQLGAHHATETIASAQRALPLATTPAQRATIHILCAEAYQLDKKSQKSLDSMELAFQEIPQGEIEWYLLRSETQRALHLKKQRVTDLATGLKHHPSAVLKAHWIDALTEDSQYSQALKEIDSELTDRRWKSSYLIKQARALRGLHRDTEAQSALKFALVEITPRINPERPDPILLADQGIAQAMLGNTDQAKHCLKELQKHHAPAWITERLEEAISE